jgi:hypothetical protein
MEIFLMSTRKIVRQNIGIDVGIPIITKLLDNRTIEDRGEELRTNVTIKVSVFELILFFTYTEKLGFKGSEKTFTLLGLMVIRGCLFLDCSRLLSNDIFSMLFLLFFEIFLSLFLSKGNFIILFSD